MIGLNPFLSRAAIDVPANPDVAAVHEDAHDIE